MDDSRVKFYGPHDMGNGWQLENAENRLCAWGESCDYVDVNDAIEFYNIKCLFDTGDRLKRWTDTEYDVLVQKCKRIPKLIGKFFASITDENFEAVYAAVERDYKQDFWGLICQYKVFLRISEVVIDCVLENDPQTLRYVLMHKALVSKYGEIIAIRLQKTTHIAKWMISYYLEAHERGTEPLFLPTEFSQELRNRALESYIDSENANFNYIQLLEGAQSSGDFPISDRLKLKAKKKRVVLQEKIFEHGASISSEIGVSFRPLSGDPVQRASEGDATLILYSREWIQENLDYPTLLNNFIYLFGYVDRFFRCTFVSHKSKLGVFERTFGVKGKNDYPIGSAFNVVNGLSALQMQGYFSELLRVNIRLENVFRWFFETYLFEEFGAKGFGYSPPSEGTTYAEKCKLLASSIDGVLKQYRLFSEDGFVDHELLEISSGHIVFSQLNSLRKNKYIYALSDECFAEQHWLYHDQSMLNFTAKTQSKYKTLPESLLSEDMCMDDFAEYQKGKMQWLVDRGVLTVDECGFLRINQIRAYILRELFKYEVICPAYYGVDLQKEFENMVLSGDLVYENTLFSRPEQAYLNYMLNKAEFSNGLDLRNKYSHDTYSQNEHTQEADYIALLKIMVLIIIKINEEFCMRDNQAPKNGTEK